MNSTHLHLIFTHLPIFGSLIGTLVLGYGMWCKSMQTKAASYLIFIFSGLGAGVAYLTGEDAEEAVENMPGIAERIIGQHEDFAVYALVSLIALGFAALLSLILTYKKNGFAKHMSIATLFVALFSFALVARTGYLGGQIRHTEINTASVQNARGSGSGEEAGD